MNMISDLMQEVASHLVGEELKILVQLREPAMQGTNALFYKNAHGVGVIDVDPTLDNDQFLRSFLHECAHARLHHRIILNTDISKRSSGSMALEVPSDDYDLKLESEAIALSDYWLAWCKDHQFNYYKAGMSELESRLWSLKNY